MLYQVNETFYSLKGEGQWTGTPMFFIRLAGCNLSCDFCDTNHEQHEELTEQQLVARARESKALRVVITGGEPLNQDITKLAVALFTANLEVHLETNGTLFLPIGLSWVAISPKQGSKLNAKTAVLADELKFLVDVSDPNWDKFISDTIKQLPDYCKPKLWVMPIANDVGGCSLERSHESINWANVDAAKAYCLAHPQFSLCMQLHKLLGIR